MKINYSYLFFCMCLIILSSCGGAGSSEPTKEEVQTFSNSLNGANDKVMEGIKSFAADLYPDAQADRNASLEKMKSIVAEAKKQVNETKDIKGGESYKMTTSNLMNAYETVMNIQYAEIVKLTEEGLTVENTDKMKVYQASAREVVDPIYKQFLDEKNAFSQKFALE
jgi:hypothetical protein